MNNEKRYTDKDVLQILQNMGHDVNCCACMVIAFTNVGLPGDEHTCELKNKPNTLTITVA